MALVSIRSGRLLAALGAVLLLFGLLGQLIGVGSAILWAHMMGGLLLLASGFALGIKDARAAWKRDERHRGARFGGNALGQLVAFVAILSVVVFMVERYPARWDLTEGKVQSLTQATRDALAQIPEDGFVEVLGFFTQSAQADLRALLELYQYESERFQFSIYDQNQRPELATRYEIRGQNVLLVCKGACADKGGSARALVAAENEITQAIRKVIADSKKVYFVTGHGEGDPRDQGERGYGLIAEALRDENMEVDDLVLAQVGEVPSDADALVIAGPDRSLIQRELDAMEKFVARGGGVLVMVDPIVVTRLEEHLMKWGIELGNDVIVDEQVHLFAGPQLGVQPLVTDYAEHPITKAFLGDGSPSVASTMFPMARSVISTEVDAVELVRTGAASWAETDVKLFTDESKVALDEGKDRQGPIAIAVARELDGGARLVVTGDSDFARNGNMAEFYNADLFINMVTWIVGEEEFATIERGTPHASNVNLTIEEFSRFRYFAILLLPEIVMLLGIGVWWRRRV